MSGRFGTSNKIGSYLDITQNVSTRTHTQVLSLIICLSLGFDAILGGQTPPIPIVLRVRVKHQASGVVGHQDKPAPRNFRSIDISQFKEFASRTGRIQFVPDELWWFCFLCRVRAFLHVRCPFALFGYNWCKSFVTPDDSLPPNVRTDPQPGQRPPDCSETHRVTKDDQTKTLTAVGSSELLNEAARRGGRRAWLRGMAWLFIAFIGGFRSESQARALVGVPGK